MLIHLLTILVLVVQPARTVGWNASCAAGQASDIGVCGPVSACCCIEIEQVCGCSVDDAPMKTPNPAVPESQRVELCLSMLPVEFGQARVPNGSMSLVHATAAFVPWRSPHDTQSILCIWQT